MRKFLVPLNEHDVSTTSIASLNLLPPHSISDDASATKNARAENECRVKPDGLIGEEKEERQERESLEGDEQAMKRRRIALFNCFNHDECACRTEGVKNDNVLNYQSLVDQLRRTLNVEQTKLLYALMHALGIHDDASSAPSTSSATLPHHAWFTVNSSEKNSSLSASISNCKPKMAAQNSKVFASFSALSCQVPRSNKLQLSLTEQGLALSDQAKIEACIAPQDVLNLFVLRDPSSVQKDHLLGLHMKDSAALLVGKSYHHFLLIKVDYKVQQAMLKSFQHPLFAHIKQQTPLPSIFSSTTCLPFVVCKAQNVHDGHLFPLSEGILFIKKPLLLLPLKDVASISTAQATGKTFDLHVHIHSSGIASNVKKTEVFSLINIQEVQRLSEYCKYVKQYQSHALSKATTISSASPPSLSSLHETGTSRKQCAEYETSAQGEESNSDNDSDFEQGTSDNSSDSDSNEDSEVEALSGNSDDDQATQKQNRYKSATSVAEFGKSDEERDEENDAITGENDSAQPILHNAIERKLARTRLQSLSSL